MDIHLLDCLHIDAWMARRRSGTLKSVASNPSSPLEAFSPAQVGDNRILRVTVHENAANQYPNVLLNRDYWPGVQNGDMFRIDSPNSDPCVFVLKDRDPTCPSHVQVRRGHEQRLRDNRLMPLNRSAYRSTCPSTSDWRRRPGLKSS